MTLKKDEYISKGLLNTYNLIKIRDNFLFFSLFSCFIKYFLRLPNIFY